MRVSGNHLVNASGTTLRLLGVDRMGTEYACVQGGPVFSGPHDAASAAAIASWHVNAVRLPLNEDCWLGINGVNPAWSGANYQSQVVSYVNLLHQYGIYVILDLQWNAPGTQLSTGTKPAPDADHAPAFWQSVATTFKNDPAVLYDLFNEPHGITWSCWLNGCSTPGYATAGMQTLINTVRSTGARQPVMVGGLLWANDMTQWLAYKPVDPANALVASFHVYDFNVCITASCWSAELLPILAQVPVVTGEMGESDCAHGFIDGYMAWADAAGVSYLAWTWTPSNCNSTPALITNYNGTPTNYGVGLRNHLLAIN